jgi:hypothetical protein
MAAVSDVSSKWKIRIPVRTVIKSEDSSAVSRLSRWPDPRIRRIGDEWAVVPQSTCSWEKINESVSVLLSEKK